MLGNSENCLYMQSVIRERFCSLVGILISEEILCWGIVRIACICKVRSEKLDSNPCTFHAMNQNLVYAFL